MGNRTPDLFNAIEALYQLSYDPVKRDSEYCYLPKLIKRKNSEKFLRLLEG